MDIRWHPRIAQSADEDGIEVALQHGKCVGRNGHTIFEVAISRPVKMSELHSRACSLNHIDGRGNYLFADAITRNDRNALLRHKLTNIRPCRGRMQKAPALIVQPMNIWEFGHALLRCQTQNQLNGSA